MNTETIAAVVTPLAEAGWNVERRTDDTLVLRREGAGEPQPADWRDRLLATLKTIQGAGAVGAKRLDESGRVHSMGELVVHPKSFHHHGRTLDVEVHQFPVEVDAVCGGVMAVSADACAAVADAGPFSGELGAIRFGLALRGRGWRCLVVPDVTTVDTFSPEPNAAESEAFDIEYGFDWRTADLDKVTTPGLRWNERFFGRAVRYGKYTERPVLHWEQFAESQPYRARAEAIVRYVAKGLGECGPGSTRSVPSVVDIGCGDGLFTHLFAQGKLEMTGFDLEPPAIAQARQATAKQNYPATAPRFEVGSATDLPLDDASVDAALLLDVIEHLPNPVRVLGEIRRIVRPGGMLAVVTPEALFGAWSDAIYHVCEYTHDELFAQLNACGFETVRRGRVGEPYRDLIALVRHAG